jgi:hypothetical protein
MEYITNRDRLTNNENKSVNEKVSNALNNLFDEDELCSICFSLNIEFRQLKGNTKQDKIKSLITLCQSKKIFQNLIDSIVERNNDSNLNSSGERDVLLLPEMMSIFRWLNDNFSESERKDICSNYVLNLANIRGNTQKIKIIEIIRWFHDRNLITNLKLDMFRMNSHIIPEEDELQDIQKLSRTETDFNGVPTIKIIALKELLNEKFNLDEIQKICFSFDIKLDNLESDILRDKIRSLVGYSLTNNIFLTLAEYALNERIYMKNSEIGKILLNNEDNVVLD